MFCQQHRGRTFCVFSSRFSDILCCDNRLSNSWYTSSVPLVQYRTLNIAISTLLSRIRVDVATCLVSDIPSSSNTPLCIAHREHCWIQIASHRQQWLDLLMTYAAMCCLWNITEIIRLPRCRALSQQLPSKILGNANKPILPAGSGYLLYRLTGIVSSRWISYWASQFVPNVLD